ncbi:MAG: amylo-alpha-1,6-glucosidase, partial [Acidobacteriota bacterium]
NSYGDFSTVRQALTLLRKYQREDGKIMHELSQSAFLIPWFEEYPYGYYHAETSPFYIISLHDYYSASGDHRFLTDSWASLKRAYQYCLTTDTDGDGLMENSKAGLGAVEVGSLLKGIHQEIYLAGLWTEALRCMGELAEAMGEKELKEECQRRFRRALQSLRERFWDEDTNQYAFCIAQDGSLVKEATAWTAVPMVFNLFEEERASGVLAHLASAAISTDWGVRMLANTSRHYQPLAYNNGAVWPFITGYVTLAEYRYHRSVSALMHLMSIARLTFVDALGFVPELLSGEFYRTIEASVPHQLFSSGMVITPLVQGLLGLKGDAPQRIIALAPHLPASWEEIKVRNFWIGDGVFSFDIKRDADKYSVSASRTAPTPYKLVFSPAFPLGTAIKGVTIDGKEAPFEAEPGKHDLHCRVEVELSQTRLIEITYQKGIEIMPPPLKTNPGDRSTSLRIIDWALNEDRFKIVVEGVRGVSYLLELKTPFEVESVTEGKMVKDEGNLKSMEVAFAAEGQGRYQQKEVIIHLRRRGGG